MQHINFPELLDLGDYCAYGGGGGETIGQNVPLSNNGNKRGSVDCDGSVIGSFTTDQKPILYRLMSVIEHRGNVYAGHYLTF